MEFSPEYFKALGFELLAEIPSDFSEMTQAHVETVFGDIAPIAAHDLFQLARHRPLTHLSQHPITVPTSTERSA